MGWDVVGRTPPCRFRRRMDVRDGSNGLALWAKAEELVEFLAPAVRQYERGSLLAREMIHPLSIDTVCNASAVACLRISDFLNGGVNYGREED